KRKGIFRYMILKKILKSFELERSADKYGPKKLLVFVVGGDYTKAVGFSREKQHIEVEEVVYLPKWEKGSEDSTIESFRAEYALDYKYASVILASSNEHVRILQLPAKELSGSVDVATRAVREMFGVEEDFSVVFQAVPGSNDKHLVNVLAAAVSTPLASGLYSDLKDAMYNPVSLMLSDACVINLLRNYITEGGYEAFLYIGEFTSTFVIFNDQQPFLIRHFGTGYRAIIHAIMTGLRFDEEMAIDTFTTNSCDFRFCLKAFSSWFNQISISMDYIERRLGKSIKEIKIFGQGINSQVLCSTIEEEVKRSVKVLDMNELLSDYVSFDGIKDLDITEIILAISEATNQMLGGFHE
ncbi:MAG: hypothetical protein ACRC37_02475, partial [Lentisphaeria bacterium]